MTRRSCTAFCAKSACKYAADPWSLLSRFGQTLPDDERVCALLVLLELDDLLLNHGDVLLAEEYLPDINSSCFSLYGWVTIENLTMTAM